MGLFSDTGKQNLMFGTNLSQKAKDYLAVAAKDYLAVADKGREYHQLQTKLENQKEQIDELVAKVNELTGKLTAPKAKGKKAA
jgi:acetylornithine/succinyldiaminopimelate/putrescine aminotransferase